MLGHGIQRGASIAGVKGEIGHWNKQSGRKLCDLSLVLLMHGPHHGSVGKSSFPCSRHYLIWMGWDINFFKSLVFVLDQTYQF